MTRRPDRALDAVRQERQGVSMKRASVITLMLIGAYSAIQAAWAVDYPLPQANSRLVGQNQTYTVQEGDKNLQAIARKFDTAAMLILEANNTIAPVPKPGTLITIPSQLLLPDAPREGIIVNLAELRLYYFPPGEYCSGFPNWYRFAGAGNAGNGNPGWAENPESDLDPYSRHP